MRATALYLVVTGLLLGSCGGGGGGDGGSGPGTNALDGAYWVVSIEGYTVADDAVRTITGAATADGTGAYAFEGVAVDHTGGAPATAIGTCEVGADRSLVLHWDGVPLQGGVTADGTCAVGASTTHGSRPRAILLLAQGGGTPEAAFVGTHHRVALGGSPDVGIAALGGGTVTFDALGALSLSATPRNLGPDGTLLVLPPADPAGTYSVGDNGRLELQWDSGRPMVGGILPDASVAAMAYSDSRIPFVYVLSKVGAGLDASTFQGSYWTAGMIHRNGGGFASFRGTLEANGVGGYQLMGTLMLDGQVPADTTDQGTYTVDDDGALTTTAVGGDTGSGGVSEDGKLFALAGGMVELQQRFLFFGVRK